jgi:electron transport complex protein RnfD
MWSVSVALTPAALWGVYVFGARALLVLIVSIASSVIVEYLLGRIDGIKELKESTVTDGSAFLTGLLIGMNMSPSVPLFIPVLASAFAMFVVKWIFGGLGSNWMNPALAGRVFVFFSFSSAMSRFAVPRTLAGLMPDTIGSATPLSYVKTSIVGGVSGLGATGVMQQGGYPFTSFAGSVAHTLGISPYAVDAFFGNIGGCIGEVSAFLLILGAIYLLYRKIITWQIPVTYLVSFAILTFIFSGIRSGLGLFHGEVLTQLFSGGLILGAFFMATDMVTSPITSKGQIIFGIGCGFFTFLFRYFGSLSESVSLAIILMNITVPTIDRYIMPVKFGQTKVKTVKERA